MFLYEIVWQETVIKTAYVRANSESAAQQCWIDGYFDSEPVVTTSLGAELIQVNEMPGPHDALCCCPRCEGG